MKSANYVVLGALLATMGGCASTRDQRFVVPPAPVTAQQTAASRMPPADLPDGGREGRMNENRCIQVLFEQSAQVLVMRNNCDFGINAAWIIMPPGVDSGLTGHGAQVIFIKPNSSVVPYILRSKPDRTIVFWACHFSQRPKWRGEYPSQKPGGSPVNVWRCEDPPR